MLHQLLEQAYKCASSEAQALVGSGSSEEKGRTTQMLLKARTFTPMVSVYKYIWPALHFHKGNKDVVLVNMGNIKWLGIRDVWL